MSNQDIGKCPVHEAAAKDIATEFYYHWHNSPGTNTADGFDSWWELNAVRFIGGSDA